MQQPIPYLTFKDNAAEAMTFYQQVLGGTLQIMSFGDAPDGDQVPPASRKLTMHAALVDGAAMVMASDTPPRMPHQPMTNVSLSLSFPDVAEAHRIHAALAEGGTVSMPMGDTFWAESFGMVKDRFGVVWMVSGGAMKQG